MSTTNPTKSMSLFHLILSILFLSSFSASGQESASIEDAEEVQKEAAKREKPALGILLGYSHQAYGDAITITNPTQNQDYSFRAVQLGFEGILNPGSRGGALTVGGGAHLTFVSSSVYDDPSDPQQRTNGAFGSKGIFLRSTYQLKFLHGQWIVPYAGYEALGVKFSLTDVDNGDRTGLAHGPVFGGLLNLAIFDPSTAFEGYRDSGLLRSYLFGEVRAMRSNEPWVASGDYSLLFGLRLEL